MDAKLDNISVDDYKKANTNLDEQVAQQKKINSANQKALKESNTNEKKAAKELKKSSNLNSKSGVTPSEKKKIQKAIKKGQEVDLSYFKEGSKGYKAAVKYNEALKAQAEAAQEAALSQEELTKQIREVAKQQFDNIEEYYKNRIALIQAEEDTIADEVSLLETKGMTVNANYYKDQISYENQKLAKLKDSKSELEEQLKSIPQGTSEWYDAKSALEDVNSEIRGCTKSIAEMNNEITSVVDNMHNKVREELSQISSTIDTIAQSWSKFDSFNEDTGAFTKEGLATLGAYATAMNTALAKQQADSEVLEQMKAAYDKAVASNQKVSESNPINVNGRQYNSKEQLYDAMVQYTDYLNSDYTEALNAENNLIDMIIDKYNEELAVVKKLTDQKKDSLAQEKELRDYQRSIRDSADNVSSLQKQIAALQGDNSQEGLARIQKLQSQLSEAQDDLQEKELEHSLNQQQKMLDSMYDELESLINAETKNRDKLLQKAIDAVNDNKNSIQDTIEEYSDKHDYKDVLGNLESGIKAMTSTTYVASVENGLQTDIAGIKTLLGDIKEAVEKRTGVTESGDDNTGDSSGTGTTTGGLSNVIQSVLNNSSQATDSPSETASPGNLTFGTAVEGNSLKEQALDFINKKAGKPKKKKKEYKAVNQKIWDLTNGKVLSDDNLKLLAELVGVKYNNSSTSGNLYKKLKSLKISGFKHGGIAKLIKAQGEDGIGILQNGEGLVAPEHVPQIQGLLDALPVMNDLADNLIKLPDLSRLQPMNSSNTIGDIQFNIEMHGVNDVETFSKQIREAYINDRKIQEMIKCDNLYQITGNASRLSRNKYR